MISVVVSENFFQVSGKEGKFGVSLVEWEQGMVGSRANQGYMCLQNKNQNPKKLKLVSK